MIMPTPDVVATVNGVKYRCESATVWWEIANPLTPEARRVGADQFVQWCEFVGWYAAGRHVDIWRGGAH